MNYSFDSPFYTLSTTIDSSEECTTFQLFPQSFPSELNGKISEYEFTQIISKLNEFCLDWKNLNESDYDKNAMYFLISCCTCCLCSPLWFYFCYTSEEDFSEATDICKHKMEKWISTNSMNYPFNIILNEEHGKWSHNKVMHPVNRRFHIKFFERKVQEGVSSTPQITSSPIQPQFINSNIKPEMVQTQIPQEGVPDSQINPPSAIELPMSNNPPGVTMGSYPPGYQYPPQPYQGQPGNPPMAYQQPYQPVQMYQPNPNMQPMPGNPNMQPMGYQQPYQPVYNYPPQNISQAPPPAYTE